MPTTRRLALVLLLPLASCASGAAWHLEDGLAAERIEMQVEACGKPREIEYHVRPESVPGEVRAAMDRLHPGGEATAAEREYEGSTLYWEITKEIDGLEVEAMFLPDGTLHSEELEVAASAVPEAVRAAVAGAPWGEPDAWEEIRDGERRLVEYHVKTSREGKRYKLLLDPGGALRQVFREVPAEIEVPVEE